MRNRCDARTQWKFKWWNEEEQAAKDGKQISVCKGMYSYRMILGQHVYGKQTMWPGDDGEIKGLGGE